MDRTQQSAPKHPLSSGMDHALDGDSEGPVKQLRRPGDNGPALQSVANNSPQVKQLKASEAAANAAVIQRKASNETGLPQALQAGMESLSGFSLDHVRVEYNSSKPAEVNALAYAEGTKIYVAPGQEEHLPEELGHVVQQMQGKVKATTEVAGKAVNDDAGMEKEAQEMGAKAAKNPAEVAPPTLQTSAMPADGIVQRRKLAYPTTAPKSDIKYYSERMTKIIDLVDRLTESARESALNWEDYLENGSPRTSLWAETASAFHQNPEVVPDFLHARFGYAIEDIVSNDLPSTVDGLKINLQVAAGHTRPDIVVLDDNYQVAWLDITAEESAGHIQNKTGAGWSNRPYIYEILYDSLKLDEVLEASSNPLTSAMGEYSAQKGQIKHENEVKETEKLRNQLLDFADQNDFVSGYGNKEDKKSDTKWKMNQLGMALDNSQCNIQAKGTLSYLDINPLRFGFKGGKSSIMKAKEFIEGKAQKKTHKEVAELQKWRLEGLIEDVKYEKECKLQQRFINGASKFILKDEVGDIHVKIGIAVLAVLRLARKADDLSNEKNQSLGNHEKAQQLIQQIHMELNDYMPETMEFSTLRDWHSNVLLLTQELSLIEPEDEELDYEEIGNENDSQVNDDEDEIFSDSDEMNESEEMNDSIVVDEDDCI